MTNFKKIRTVSDGWALLNLTAVEALVPVGHGFSVRMVSGMFFLVDGKEGKRLQGMLCAPQS